MAPVLHHPQLDFHAGPVHHAPSPLGFGFGLSSNTHNSFASSGFGCASSSAVSASSHFATNVLSPATSQASSQPRVAKRRHDGDDDGENGERSPRDITMDRSPTPPDRPKRAAPKRLRTAPADIHLSKDDAQKKLATHDDVDIGVLLASLPSSAHLPIITSLLAAHPQLKSSVLQLIPRPTLDAATQAIAVAAKKICDAHPYSANPLSSVPTTSSSFGFGASARPNPFSGPSSGLSFGAPPPPQQQQPPLRDDYILSRLSPHMSDFISTCMTYLPYFSLAQGSSSQESSGSHALMKEKAHPNETFQFLAAVTNHLISLPHLACTSLIPQVLPRLVEEWTAWINKVDAVVNCEAGMFGQESVRNWERTLDEYATAQNYGLNVFATLRDRWVQAVGWLVGRQLIAR